MSIWPESSFSPGKQWEVALLLQLSSPWSPQISQVGLSPGSPKELEDDRCTHIYCGCLGTVGRNLLVLASSQSTDEALLSTRGWSRCKDSPQFWLIAQPRACLARTQWSSLCYILPSGGGTSSPALSWPRLRSLSQLETKFCFHPDSGHHLPKCMTCGYWLLFPSQVSHWDILITSINPQGQIQLWLILIYPPFFLLS